MSPKNLPLRKIFVEFFVSEAVEAAKIRELEKAEKADKAKVADEDEEYDEYVNIDLKATEYTDNEYGNDYKKIMKALKGLYCLVNNLNVKDVDIGTVRDKIDEMDAKTKSIIFALLSLKGKKDQNFISKLMQGKFSNITAEEKREYTELVFKELCRDLYYFDVDDNLLNEALKLYFDEDDEEFHSAEEFTEEEIDRIKNDIRDDKWYENCGELRLKILESIDFGEELNNVCDEITTKIKNTAEKISGYDVSENILAPVNFFNDIESTDMYYDIYDSIGVKLAGKNIFNDLLEDDERYYILSSLKDCVERALNDWEKDVTYAIMRKIERNDFFNEYNEYQDQVE